MQDREYLETEGMNFRQLLLLIKKSLPLLIASILVVALIATISIMAALNGTKGLTADIEYDYEGGKSGVAPDGSTLDLSVVKSDKVLTKAIEKNGLGLSVAELRANINIMTTIDDTKQRKYTLVFDDYSKLGLSNAQAVALLDQIVYLYSAEFNNVFFPHYKKVDMISENLIVDNDYIVACNVINNKFMQINNMLEALKKDSSFVSPTTKMNLEALNTEFTNLKNGAYSKLRAYIQSNIITKDANALSLYYTYTIDSIDTSIAENIFRSEALSTALGKFNTDNSSLSEIYYKMFSEYNGVLTTIKDLKIQKSQLESEKTKMANGTDGTPSMVAEINKLFNEVYADLSNSLVTFNIMQDEYVSYNRASNSITISSSIITQAGISKKMAFVTIALAVMLDACMAVFVTNIIVKKKFAKKLALNGASNSEIPNEEKCEIDSENKAE